MNMFNITYLNDYESFDSLIQNTYLFGICFGIIAFAIALLIASLIKWQGYPDRSYIKRRVWCIIAGIVIALFFALWNALYCAPLIDKNELPIDEFTSTYIISTIICLVVFILISIVTMLIFRSSKWGSILGPTKNK